MKATARAHANIALIKYWGKRDRKLNLPAAGSISITLEALSTVTRVEFLQGLKKDRFILNGESTPVTQTERVTRFLDLIREQSGTGLCAQVTSKNNFPTGAGLASSASAFAGLALAGSRAAGLALSFPQLSELARKGSGSAARSVFGGFVEMQAGVRKDGTDAIARQIAPETYWDLRVLIAITSDTPKKTGSTEGMLHTEKTSPYFREWVRSSVSDLKEMQKAISIKDLSKLGELSEYNCLKMHALMLSARPGLIYWNENTLALIHLVRELRNTGTEAYFTIDAGPQVKVLCEPENVPAVKNALENSRQVLRIIETGLGGGAVLVKDTAL